MSPKHITHIAVCAGMVLVLWFRFRHTTRRPLVMAMIVAWSVAGLAPIMYRLGIPLFPRFTIGWPQLVVELATLVWFTPKPTGVPVHDQLDEDDDAFLIEPAIQPEQRMPLH